MRSRGGGSSVISTQHVRQLALALLLSTGCGDDGGDDDDGPASDGGQAEAGSPEGGAPDGGPAMDGGNGDPDAGDARVLLDANLADGSSLGDASADELQAALMRDGVRADVRRAQLVFNAACRKRDACDGTLVEQQCTQSGIVMWQGGAASGYSDACLDASLDLYACFATVNACDFDSCESLGGVVFDLCPQSDAGS